MLGRRNSLGPALLVAIALSIGCSGKTPALTNPLDTADKVPPPSLRVGPGGEAPYYPQTAPANPPPAGSPYQGGPTTFAPGETTPSGYPAGGESPSQSGYTPVDPGAAPQIEPGSATPYYGAAAQSPRPTGGPVAGGDSVRIPEDAAALRFATPMESSLARQSSQPVDRPLSQQMVASNTTPQRRTATANGWIAGSAPVRSSTPTMSPRVRVPGDTTFREPVSIAALRGGVSERALEAVPGDARGGEPAPLRVASPPAKTGWR